MAGINFSQLLDQAGDGTFPLLDPGIYTLEVKDAEFKVASTGSPMIAVRFQEPEKKITIFENWVLTEKAIFRLKMFLKHTGINPPGDGVEPESKEFDDFIDSLIGVEVTANVQKEKSKYQGEEREQNVIKNYSDQKPGKGGRKTKRTL